MIVASGSINMVLPLRSESKYKGKILRVLQRGSVYYDPATVCLSCYRSGRLQVTRVRFHQFSCVSMFLLPFSVERLAFSNGSVVVILNSFTRKIIFIK